MWRMARDEEVVRRMEEREDVVVVARCHGRNRWLSSSKNNGGRPCDDGTSAGRGYCVVVLA